jgi:hypothetical protein
MLSPRGLVPCACCSRAVPPGLFLCLAHPGFCFVLTGLSPWWVINTTEMPTMGLATHGAKPHLGPALPWENPRDFPPVLLQTRVDTPTALQTRPFPSILAPWGLAPCTCCSRGFAPRFHLSCMTAQAFKNHSFALAGLQCYWAVTIKG